MKPKLTTFLKSAAVVLLVYLFLVSIRLMGSSFKLLGSDFAKTLIQTTSNPFVGLLIGILATSIIQSSSTTTSLTVGLVAGGAFSIEGAIPVIMGANIGTSVTNLLVSMAHISNREEFRRAFSGAVVHDNFNLLAVIVLFPLEMLFHPIQRSALFLEQLFIGKNAITFTSPLDYAIHPVSDAVRNLITFMMHNDIAAAIALIVLSMLILFFSLFLLVKLMKSMILDKFENLLHHYMFKTPSRAFTLGIIFTAIVQSSSVTTSLIIPLVGAGLLTLRQIFPYTLGANIGTTVTALLASMATGSSLAVTVALAHLLFNIYGIVIWYPLKVVPIRIAEFLGDLCYKNRLYGIAWVAIVFYIIPILLILVTRGG